MFHWIFKLSYCPANLKVGAPFVSRKKRVVSSRGLSNFPENRNGTGEAEMGFVVTGLSPEPYLHLYGMSDADLAANGVTRYLADEAPGFPDRIEMRDADIGQSLLLLNHVSMGQGTPYQASHAIFVREGAEDAYRRENEIPDVMFRRLLSLRAFDDDGMMVDADIAEGEDIALLARRLLEIPKVSSIHAHNVVRGCYSGKIERC
jgi:hypothetical protein